MNDVFLFKDSKILKMELHKQEMELPKWNYYVTSYIFCVSYFFVKK